MLGLGATLTPILTYPAAALFRMDRFRAIRTFGLVLGVGGVALVVVPETSLPSRDMAPWVLLSFVGPVLYVANALIISWLKPPPDGALPLGGRRARDRGHLHVRGHGGELASGGGSRGR